MSTLDLVGAKLRGAAGQVVDLAGAVANAPFEWRIDGTPSLILDVSDVHHALLRSGTRARPVLDVDGDGRLDGAMSIIAAGERYVSTGIDKDPGAGEQIRFVHWIAHDLDQVNSYRSAPAGATTGPQFVASMVRESPLLIPAHISTVTATPVVTEQSPRKHRGQLQGRDAARGTGFAADVSFKIQGATADSEQVRFLTIGLSTLEQEKSPLRSTISYLCAVIVESYARDMKDGDGTSEGGLQLLASTAKQLHVDPHDVAAITRAYARTGFTDGVGSIEYSRKHPTATTAQIAQHCQGSAFPDRYKTKDGIDIEAEAQAIYRAWGGATTSEASGIEEAVYERGSKDEREGSYAASQRIGEAVQERAFIAQGAFYYQPDSVLMASRPAVTISDSHPAVEQISWQADDRVMVRRMQVQVRADVATLLGLAARCIVVEGEGEIAMGARRDGRWLVTGISMEAIGQQRGTLELAQPRSLLPEPKSSSAGGGGGSMASRASSSAARTRQFDDPRVVKARRRIDQITAQRQLYSYGGGHGSFSGPYDCSGLQSAVLHAAGLLDAPIGTAELADWGNAGEGEVFTVWVHQTSDPHTSHTYSTWKSTSGSVRVCESGDHVSRFAGWRPGAPHPRAGFEPRHWDGL